MNKLINTKLNSFASLIAASVVALACTAGAGTAFADEISLMHTKVVSYSDLNLDSCAGRRSSIDAFEPLRVMRAHRMTATM